MCLKNINTDVLFFDSAALTPQDKMILYSVEKDICEATVKREVEGGETCLIIDDLSFILSITAIEKEKDGVALHEKSDTPQNTIFFDHNYQVCLRITETKSGRYVDLSTFNIRPIDESIKLCRRIFNKKLTLRYHNIPVAVPPEGKDLCVLKVLIQQTDTCEADPDKWIIQSMHPIRLVEAKSEPEEAIESVDNT